MCIKTDEWKHTSRITVCVYVCVCHSSGLHTKRKRRGAVLVIKEMNWGVKSTEGDRFL